MLMASNYNNLSHISSIDAFYTVKRYFYLSKLVQQNQSIILPVEMDISILSWITAIIILSMTYWYYTIPTNLPPGTAGLPIVGYLPFLNKHVHLTFTKLAQKFGNVCHVYLGSQLTLILNDFESIKQAFKVQGETFSGRCHMTDFEDGDGEISGVIMTDGDYWKQHRRFIIRNLRDYGIGKSTLEPLILNEIQYFLAEVRKHDGKGPFELRNYLAMSMTNNIHILVHGRRYDYEDPVILDLIKSLNEFDEFSHVLPLEMFFPWLKPVIYQLDSKRLSKLNENKKTTDVATAAVIEETSRNFSIGQHDNYVKAYLTEKNSRLKANPKQNETIFTDKGLLGNVNDLIAAGTDTSATTLTWAALYMAKYPEIQKKVQDEIDQVIGHREPSYNDRNSTPYTEATLQELHRMVSLVPVAVPHRVINDTTLYGYNIPKDTMVIPNLRAVHYDQKLWGDPENFRPERFIGSNGECFKPEYLLPFSIGKRACAGEPLAKMELFLFFVSLIQHFTFLPSKESKMNFESVPGLVVKPKNQLICVKVRL
ncbi:hypothetical protein CHUAL_008499 [Chamberlinius hualienensis]